MKLNEIKLEDIKQHLKIETSDEDSYLMIQLDAAKNYIYNYTGLTKEEATQDDLASVALMVVADLYENREASYDSKDGLRLNRIYESMLGMHCKNLL